TSGGARCVEAPHHSPSLSLPDGSLTTSLPLARLVDRAGLRRVEPGLPTKVQAGRRQARPQGLLAWLVPPWCKQECKPIAELTYLFDLKETYAAPHLEWHSRGRGFESRQVH